MDFQKRHVFIIGSKSIGQYGGYETFVDKLIEQHENDTCIQYHIACKANGEGHMDESALANRIDITKRFDDGTAAEFYYRNAHVFKIKCPSVGPAVAIYYDTAAVLYCLNYCKQKEIKKPIFYILACRIGLSIDYLSKKIHAIGGFFYLNPDGHEWKRSKWPPLVRKYWKWSEKKMVMAADLVICDSVNIEKYIREEYKQTNTTYISYGADISSSSISDNDVIFLEWQKKHRIVCGNYFLIVGRFVPENNYEIMIREFMMSGSSRDLVIITNNNEKLRAELDKKLHYSTDSRIKIVGTVYNKDLLKKIREKAFCYIHGHEVGGTNPSLLESLGSTQLNLLLDVGFNREVGQDAALYWKKDLGDLSGLINSTEIMPNNMIEEYGKAAKKRVALAYSWKSIAEKYKRVWQL